MKVNKNVIIKAAIVCAVAVMFGIGGYIFGLSGNKATINNLKDQLQIIETENSGIRAELTESIERAGNITSGISDAISELNASLGTLTEIEQIIDRIERAIKEIENTICKESYYSRNN